MMVHYQQKTMVCLEVTKTVKMLFNNFYKIRNKKKHFVLFLKKQEATLDLLLHYLPPPPKKVGMNIFKLK